ncbi:MAG TPA: HDOD domain-containing protein [Candidatus Hydrogenedentes bacterium]|nr:HDOD domain-containing protein [Candidatus Hydrogenedentota bacterium]HOL76835.1 HDOD domain-containing protein [Candidatus Hydrogenedentota bacterium]HPO86223.1 HDOD domain-containing protein [Candidatus Hydrogenedentota bacterium]
MIQPHEIDLLLEEIVTLPSVPQTLARITQMMSKPDVSLAEVSKVVSTDPSIALKTLRLVNSALYGLRNKVVSVDHAVAMLGLDVIRNLVLTATVFDTFKRGSECLLTHSVACGVALRAVAIETNFVNPSDIDGVFVFGLLHDVGKIIFHEFLPEETTKAEEVSRERQIPMFQAEREIIGCDHAEMGARLALTWQLPDELVHAVGYHHFPSSCKDEKARQRAAMLSIADVICWASGLASVPDVPVTVPAETWDLVGIRSRNIPSILDRFFNSMPEMRELLEIAR